MIRLYILINLCALLFAPALCAQTEPCDPPLVASISVSGAACGGSTVFITFHLPEDDDDAEGYNVRYSIGGNVFLLSTIFNGHTVGHFVQSSTTVTLLRVDYFEDDDDNCFTIFNQTIPISVSAPVLNISNQTNPGCGQNNGSLTVLATGGTAPYQYRVNGGIFQNSGTFSGLSAGAYTILVRDAEGCTAEITATLGSPAAPNVTITSQINPGCGQNNGRITASASGGIPPYQYSLNGATYQTSATFNGLESGSYEVFVRDAANCTDVQLVTLQDLLPPPQANSDGVFNLTTGDRLEVEVLLNDVLSASVDLRILKNPAQGSAFFNNQDILEYQPNATANGGDTVVYEICYTDCPDICDTAFVLFSHVRNDDPCVLTGDTSNIFTNGLTPNGDGRNDFLVFRVVSVDDCAINYAKSDLIIYNRWGDIVFEASPYNNDWGGANRHGNDLPPGVYYFVLRITLEEVYTQFGSVILIR